MRLIDADKLSETIQDSINLMESKGVDCSTARWIEIIADNAPMEEAVPLKPLAALLAWYAMPPVHPKGSSQADFAEAWEEFLRKQNWEELHDDE